MSIDVMAAGGRKDAVRDFLRESGCVRFRSTGYVSVVTADGETLGIVNPTSHKQGLHGWLGKRFEEWSALSEDRRRPGAVQVPDLDEVDPNFVAIRPPEGALILRVTARTMQRDTTGAPRLLCADDLAERSGGYRGDAQNERLISPVNDFMWILEDEWRALIPNDAEVGQSFDVPEPLRLRYYGYQINPNLGLQGSRAYSPKSIRSSRLTAIVEKIDDASMRVRLEGEAVLDAAGGEATRLVHRPAVLGHLTYDRKKDAVIEFELVSFGELSGRLHRLPASFFSEAPRLFGVVAELIPEPKGAEKLRPNAARMSGSKPLVGLRNYLNPRGR